MVKLGVIGLGHMGGFHASICATLPQVELVAIADPNIKNWDKINLPDVKKTTDFNEWIDLVDGLIIAVPTDFHYPVAKACLEKNKHILLEKPLTKNFEQAKELFALAQAHNVTLHVGHVERFNGAVQELKKIINKPYLIESHRMGPFSPRVQKDTVILDLMIHDLDIILSLVNQPVKTIQVIGNHIHSSLSDIAVVQIQFADGTLANVVSSRASHIKARTMTIHQQDAFISLDFTTQDISIHRHSSSSTNVGQNQLKYKQESTIERLFVYKDNPLKLEILHFVNAITTGKETLSPEQDLEALKVTLELEKLVEQNYDCNHSRNGKSSSSCM